MPIDNPIPMAGAATERAYAMEAVRSGGNSLGPRAVSYGEMIANDVANVEQRLADLKRVQDILTKYPEFEELLTLVGRVGRY